MTRLERECTPALRLRSPGSLHYARKASGVLACKAGIVNANAVVYNESSHDIGVRDVSMDLGLAGKTAIVTGGSSGIGLACAKALRREGVALVVAALQEGLPEATNEITAVDSSVSTNAVIGVATDLSQAEEVNRVVSVALNEMGRIDILVNCAGAARAGAFFDLPDRAYLDAWNLKLLGYIRAVRAVAAHMKERRDGRIICIVGASGRTPGPAMLPVSTTNAALLSFVRGVSKELATYNVRINAISPGPTATPRADRLAEQTALARGVSTEEAKAEVTRNIPLGHLVRPQEIAALTLLLASDLCPSITGAEFLIDGGQTPGM